jgi:hypothetical protein
MNRDIGGLHSISCATLVPRAAQWQQMLPRPKFGMQGSIPRLEEDLELVTPDDDAISTDQIPRGHCVFDPSNLDLSIPRINPVALLDSEVLEPEAAVWRFPNIELPGPNETRHCAQNRNEVSQASSVTAQKGPRRLGRETMFPGVARSRRLSAHDAALDCFPALLERAVPCNGQQESRLGRRWPTRRFNPNEGRSPVEGSRLVLVRGP